MLPPTRWADWLELNTQDDTLLAPLAAASLAVTIAWRGKEAPSEDLITLARVVEGE